MDQIKKKISLFIPPFPVRVNNSWLYGAAIRFFWTGHERPIYHLISRIVKKDMRVADVGACFGSHTATLQKFTDKVIAFEPDKRAVKVLKRNFPKLQVIESAVGSREGVVKMTLSTKPGTSHVSQDGAVETPIVPLKKFGHFDFVKIDAEGEDLEVIKGLDCSKSVKFTCEFSPKQLDDPQSFLSELRKMGVDYQFIIPNGTTVHVPDDALIAIAKGSGHINLYGEIK